MISSRKLKMFLPCKLGMGLFPRNRPRGRRITGRELGKQGKEGGREERLTDKHCFIGIACLCSQLVV